MTWHYIPISTHYVYKFHHVVFISTSQISPKHKTNLLAKGTGKPASLKNCVHPKTENTKTAKINAHQKVHNLALTHLDSFYLKATVRQRRCIECKYFTSYGSYYIYHSFRPPSGIHLWYTDTTYSIHKEGRKRSASHAPLYILANLSAENNSDHSDFIYIVTLHIS